jgi:hypothetical protein
MQGMLPARNLAKSFTGPDFGFDSVSPDDATISGTSQLEPLPDWTPRHVSRRVPIIVRINRLIRTLLVTFCGMSLLGYGLDVAASSEVSKLQQQARRLSEQNTELSAQLLRAISFQGIQANVVGRAGLRVPEHVVITKEVQPPVVKPFKPNKYFLPLIPGY